MTNQDALIVIASGQQIAGNLLAAFVGQAVADELIAGSIPTAAAAADSIVGKLAASKTTYDAGPTTFVDTPANIDTLDDAIDAYVAVEKTDIAVVSGEAYDALQLASPEV